MFVPFEKLPDSARIWIYQADRKLSADEQRKISIDLEVFTNQWTAHNQMLGASFCVLYDQFVIVAVNENVNQASGCSIDASVHQMKKLGDQFHINFFNRTQIAFWKNEQVTMIQLADLSKKLEEGAWSGETKFFDNTIQTKGDLPLKWKIKAADSWLSRYLKKAIEERTA